LRNGCKCCGGGAGLCHLRGVRRGADQDEIIIHDLPTVGAVACGDEILLRRFGMNQDGIHIARLSQTQRLPGAHDKQLHFKARIFRDGWQQDV